MFKTKIAAFAACFLLSFGAAQAGTVVAIGDTNITSVNNGDGNAQFFENLLGSGSTVQVLQTASFGDTSLNSFYSSLSGVSSSIYSGAVTEASLSGVDLLLAPLVDPFSVAEVDAIQGFLDGGGIFVLLGENSYFGPYNSTVNSILSDLGTGMSLTGACNGYGTAVPGGQFGTGVGLIYAPCGSSVMGGTAELQYTNGAILAASFNTQSTVVPLPASLPLALGGLALLGLIRRKA